MSNLVVTQNYNREQINLIKATVAKNATDSEMELFLYRCKNMDLDPLKPGQIHFVKYGQNPGSIVVGIDGFRSKAAKTGKHVGTKRGVVRDDKGKCLGAWCEVYRSDWQHPAREEVSLVEYNAGKAQWLKMPETMIKKVAEAAALRMAFPDELGGLYSPDEMDQAEPRGHSKAQEVTEKISLPPNEAPRAQESTRNELDEALASHVEPGLGDYVRKAGKHKGKSISLISKKDNENFLKWFDDTNAKGDELHQSVRDDAAHTRDYLAEQTP